MKITEKRNRRIEIKRKRYGACSFNYINKKRLQI